MEEGAQAHEHLAPGDAKRRRLTRWRFEFSITQLHKGTSHGLRERGREPEWNDMERILLKQP